MSALRELQDDMADYQRGPPRITVLTFDAAADAPALPELIEDVLPARGLAVVYGGSGVGKSFLVTDVALHVAMGWPWRGRDVLQGAVAYVAAEAQASFGRRLRAWRQERLGDEAIAPPFYVVPSALDLHDPAADTAPLIEALKALPGPLRIVAVDTLARTMGQGDENAARDMGVLVGNLDRIGRELGALVLIVHHAGKDETKGARGSGALRAACDTEILVEASGKQRSATVKKQRDGEDGQAFAFTLQPVQIGEKPNGKPLTSCVVEHEEDGPAGIKRPRATGQAALALARLHDCLADGGRPGKGGKGQPAHVAVVSLDTWRERCRAAGLGGGDNAKTQQTAFRRAMAKLLEIQAIGVWNDEVWAA